MERPRDNCYPVARWPILAAAAIGFLVSSAPLTGQIFFIDSFNPAELGQLNGIAFDDLTGEAWISSTNGTIYHLGGFEAIPEPSTLALWGTGFLCLFLFRGRTSAKG